MKTVYVVNTPFIQIELTDKGYTPFITTKDGSIVEHETFPKDAQGLVNALILASEVCAGKFYLARVKSVPETKNVIDYKKKGGLNGN